MSEDWFSRGRDQLIKDIAEESLLSENEVSMVYSFLVNKGLIDYDTEKEYFFENYESEDEED